MIVKEVFFVFWKETNVSILCFSKKVTWRKITYVIWVYVSLAYIKDTSYTYAVWDHILNLRLYALSLKSELFRNVKYLFC